jgi:hypothetical protein
LYVNPGEGHGWLVIGIEPVPQQIQFPNPFQTIIYECLFDKDVIRGLVASCKVNIQGHDYIWAYFLPRTDSIVSLVEKSVGCNILLAKTKPYLSGSVQFPNPEQICVDSTPHIRGYARIELYPPAKPV